MTGEPPLVEYRDATLFVASWVARRPPRQGLVPRRGRGQGPGPKAPRDCGSPGYVLALSRACPRAGGRAAVVTKASAGKGEKRMTLGSPRCPACGSLFVVPPSPWDHRPLWRCQECGAAWLAPEEGS